jgi:adenylate cyclase
MRVTWPSFTVLTTCGFVAVALLWGGFLGYRQIAGIDSLLDRVEYLTVDLRFLLAGARPAPRGVVIVAIDDETIHAAGAYPLPRSAVAAIVRNVAALDPQAIAIDMAFLEAGQPEQDAQLGDALRSTKSVIAAIGLFDRGAEQALGQESGELGLIPEPSSILRPIPEFRDAAMLGLVNIATDANGIPRFIPMVYRSGDKAVPSFALAAASVALNTEPVLAHEAIRLAGRRTETDLGYHLPIRYYGPRGSIKEISAARFLRGDLTQEDVRGQVVVLGVTALGVGDTFATPFDRIVPGVEIFATGINNLLAGDGLVRTALLRKVDAGAAILLPCITVLLMSMRRAFAGLGLAGLATVAWGTLTFVAFLEGFWLNVAVPLAALIPVAVAYGATRLAFDRYALGRLAVERTALSKFQSPLLIEHILKNPRFLETPVRQNVAAVFLDLSGFTGVAETLGAQWTRDLLAEFHALIERKVATRRGFVVSFAGDGAMIIFGLPEPRQDDALRALLAVKGLHDSIVAWLAGLPPVARDRLSVRIGAHFGLAVVSRLGPVDHQHITATGDTVNVASRLMEVAKQRQASVVVSEDLCAAGEAPAFSGDAVASESLEVKIRGRVQTLRVRTWR